MSTNTTTRKTSTSTSTSAAADSTVRPRRQVGEHRVAVQFSAWGPQQVSVKASSGGGRGGAPYIVVQVGACLTYAYDRAAVEAHVLAWRDAEQVNSTVRLPDAMPTTTGRPGWVGEDLSVLCNVTGSQRHTAVSSTGADGRRRITVTVGAVTIDVHTTTALRSYLSAWLQAQTATEMLEPPRTTR